MADMDVYLYPNDSNDDSLANDAKGGLTTALDIVIANTKIATYNITIRKDYPQVSDSTRKEFYDSFSSWRVNNKNDIGCHLGVSSSIGGGLADGGNTSNPEDDAFVSPKDAVAGDSGVTTDHFRNTCCQEVFHTFIDKDLPAVQSLTGSDNNEHSLGEVTKQGVTPMATGYENTYAGEGVCSLTQGVSGYTQDPTYCTNQSLEATAEDENIV